MTELTHILIDFENVQPKDLDLVDGRTARNWELTPAYDLVPAPLVSLERRGPAMTVGTYGRTASVYNLLSQSERFGL